MSTETTKNPWIKDAADAIIGNVKSIIDPVEKAKQLSELAKEWIDPFTESKDEKREMSLELLRATTAQNLEESKSKRILVAAWRPFIGWVLGLGLFFYYPVRFAVATWLWAKQVLSTGVLIDYPIDATDLINLIVAMLGLAGYRTYEKRQKLTR